MNFDGKCAIVTGVGGGIGEQIGLDLLEAGARVALVDLKPEPEGFAKFGDQRLYIQGDLSDDGFLNGLCDRAAEFLGGLDYVANVAGIAFWGGGPLGDDGSVVDLDWPVWGKTMKINLEAAALISRHAVPHMRKRGGGALVHVASVSGARSHDNLMEAGALDAYQISKAGVISLSRAIALSHGRENIRSNSICPGAIWTPMTDAIYQQEGRIEKMAKRTPINRVGKPKDISNACLFLLSDEASFITGTELMVDGGLMAKLC
jgi:NAD(P)-dependent dehydrogenase (short-subunit alcohol dehydrogenase family)